MIIKKLSLFSFLLLTSGVKAQTVSAVYKTEDLLKRIEHSSQPMIINFWATWCKPCVEELPAFDSLAAERKDVKTLLVCLDFKEGLDQKVNPFLQKKKIQSECVLLDEINGNDYIDKISKEWSGAIPATLIKAGDKKIFLERKLNLTALKEELKKL